MQKEDEKMQILLVKTQNTHFLTIFIMLKISTIEKHFGEFWKIFDKKKRKKWAGDYSLTMTAPRALRRCTMS